MPTMDMRSIASQYAPGTTIDPRTGLPVGMGQMTGTPTPAGYDPGMATIRANQGAMGYLAPGYQPSTTPAAGQETWDQWNQIMGGPAGYGNGSGPGTGTTIGALASGGLGQNMGMYDPTQPISPTNQPGNTQGIPTGEDNNWGFGTQPVDPSGQVGSFVNNLTGGANGGGGLNVAGGQPNYPLNIGSYLNPMMKYALDNGISTINNSAAASGNLNSGNTMKELMDFGTGQASNNFNNAAQIAAGQQAFDYGVDNNDRNFQWNAQNADRNYNLQHDMGLASLGMQGLGQTNQNASVLAQILSRNIMAGGTAQAGGTIGSSNAIAQAILAALGIGAGNLSQPTSGG